MPLFVVSNEYNKRFNKKVFDQQNPPKHLVGGRSNS